MQDVIDYVSIITGDDQDYQKIKPVLERQNFQCQRTWPNQFQNGHNLQAQPDLVIIAHTPPVIDSLAVLRQLQRQSQKFVVVLLVQANHQAVAIQALSLDVQVYLIQDQEGHYLECLNDAIIEAQAAWQEKQIYRLTEHALAKRAAQLDIINEIGQQIVAVRELDDVLRQTANLLRENFNYHHVALFLLKDEVVELKAIAGIYTADFPARHTQKQSEGIIGWVASHGQKIVANNVLDEPRFVSLIGDRTETKSELCLPIKLGDETLGILDIQSTVTDDFDHNTVLAMETLVDAIAVAIQNAHLYEAFKFELFERGQAEKTLQAAYQRLTFYVENSPLIALEWDHAFRLTHWPQEAEEFFGWDIDEVLGKRVDEWNFVHAEDLSHMMGMINRLLSGEDQGNSSLLRHLTSTGEIIYCEWYHSAILNEYDQLVSIVSFVLDVTDAQKAVAHLQQSEQRFRQVISSLSDHIYVGKVSQDKKGYVTDYTSPNVERLTGYPIEKFTDFNFWQTLIHPDDLRDVLPHDAPIGFDSEVEYRMHHANGQLIWVRDSRRIELEWDPVHRVNRLYVYGVVSNITRRKMIEFELGEERALLAQRVDERTAKLRMANIELGKAAKLKDEFLASMSHELRTPLNAILGKSETLQEGVHGPLNEKQAYSLKTIEDSGRHLLTLINEILDISKIEAGKLDLDVQPVAVKWICETSLQLVKEMAHRKHLQVKFTFDENVKMITADGRRLKQILVNLLSNAVKFTPEQGEVGLNVQGDIDNEVVHFHVWDTGIGIPAEKIAQLFQPFVQLDSSLSRLYDGTGLGLSLVYRMTKLHGGGVSVKSQIDKGSQFTISLPWLLADQSKISSQEIAIDEIPEATRQKMATRKNKDAPLILVVEDNETNIDMLLDYLPYHGYRMITAHDGGDALDVIYEQKPDLILMDIQTPGIDGLEATRQIRADARFKAIPIIALTGLAMPGDRERCLAAGVNDYLSKPVSLKKLVILIETWLKRSYP